MGKSYETVFERLLIDIGKSCKTVFGCHFRGNFDANLMRSHNDTNSTGKDTLNKAQLFSLSIFKT